MQNCPLLKVDKKESIHITWKGSEECFVRNRRNLDLALGGGSLSWKRDSQKVSYPLNIRYKPKFVAFSEKLICKDVEVIAGDIAYLHLYFVYPSSVDDYRYNIRPVVSDWFARLNESESAQWIIVFDSSKTREKKVRTSLLEKLRSDFAKYLSRFCEISDAASAAEKNAFFSLVQSSLISSFNVYADSLQNSIQKIKGSAGDENFLPPKVVNLQYKLCHFYWNLGLIENALHELDDLDRFLTSTVSRFSTNLAQSQLPHSQNKWLKRSKLAPFGTNCPHLGVLMRQSSVNTENVDAAANCSLAELRAFILANQILLTFHMFYQRYVVLVGNNGGMALLFGENLVETSEVLRQHVRDSGAQPHNNGDGGNSGSNGGSVSPMATRFEHDSEELLEPNSEMALQLCHNFVSFVLRYAHDALTHLMDDLIILKASYCPALLYVLIVVWYAEVFLCCESLANILEMENASYFICQMTHLQCDALLKLLPIFSEKNPNDVIITRRWFEASQVVEEMEPSTSAFRQISAFIFASVNDDAKPNNTDDNMIMDESLHNFVLQKLRTAVEIFRNFGWERNVEAFNLKIVELLRKSSDRSAFNYMAENFRACSGGKFSNSVVTYAQRLTEEFEVYTKVEPELLFDCHFVLALQEKRFLNQFFQLIRSSDRKFKKSNLRWRSSQKFPWRIRKIFESLIGCDLHGELRLKIVLEGDFSYQIGGNQSAEWPDICIKAGFKALTTTALHSLEPSFCCQTTKGLEQQDIYRFSCFSSGKFYSSNLEYSANEDISRENSASNIHNYNIDEGTIHEDESPISSAPESQLIYLKAISEKRLSEYVSELEFVGKANLAGCFALDHFHITMCTNLVWYLDYQLEIARLHSLPNVLCFVNTKKPQVSITDTSKAAKSLLAGVAQRLCLELNVGTVATNAQTELKVSFVGTKPLMQFLNNGTEWSKEALIYIPNLKSEQLHRQDVILCLDIDRMNFSADQSLALHYDIRVDWLERTWFFPLNFLPIMNVRSMTSQLGDRVLFEVDIQRCDGLDALQILPDEAILLQDQSVAKDPVEAVLLNPLPFQPIVANSSYRFVWQLPNSKIGKSIPITHFIKLLYSVKIDDLDEKNGDKSLAGDTGGFYSFMPLKEVVERKYAFENKLTFAVQKVEYEVCAHVLSERPQSVLCRVDLQCDLIVSLRSLSSGIPESIIVVVEADPQFWISVDKFKVVHIKGSGIGQTTFAIIPKSVGFLPYPSIFVHRYINADQNDRRSFNETTFIGERLNSFHRNQGKQIHVLGHLQNSDETSSMSSSTTVNSTGTKKSLKSQAKDKIQKLFELKD